MGIPVVIAENGQGFPVKPVEDNAPVMTVAENGLGAPIVISELGAPFIVEGIVPPVEWDWQTFSMTNGGDGVQWVGYSVGGATLPNPAFGSISNEPTDKATLLSFYQDTASGVVLAVFSGGWEAELAGLEVSLGGLVLEPFEIEIIGGNTWLRYDGMPGLWAEGVVYEVLFGQDLVQAPFAITEAILGSGGLDYSLYDSGLASSLFQDAAGTTPAILTNPVGRWNVRQKPPHFASQSTSGQRPALQSDGVKFDGVSQNLLTDCMAQAGANCIIAQVTVPAIIATTQICAGTQNVNGRFRTDIFPDGRLSAAVGDGNALALNYDLRGRNAIIALSVDGSVCRLFADDQSISGSYSGIPNSTVPFRLGANNAGGTPSNFFGGSIKRVAFGKTAITLEQFQQIRSEWLAAS